LTIARGQVQCAVSPPAASQVVRRDRRNHMLDYRDLFQWQRFITSEIVKIFYWLAVGMFTLFGLSGMISGLALMALHPLAGVLWILGSLFGVLIGVLFARILSEFFLIIFRINGHLAALREDRRQMTEDR
jgi:uncharacterized membrane protein